MMANAHTLLKFSGLMIAIAYIVSIGSVYAQANQTNNTSQDVTGPILAQALKSLQDAKKAYDSGNKTGALDEAHQAMYNLQILGLPKNCVINNNEMFQCNFPK